MERMSAHPDQDVESRPEAALPASILDSQLGPEEIHRGGEFLTETVDLLHGGDETEAGPADAVTPYSRCSG